MRIIVHAKPGAHEQHVRVESDGTYTVAVVERAQDGDANAAIVRALAEHFHVSRSSVRIRAGHASRTKIIIID